MSNRLVDRGAPLKGLLRTPRDVRQDPSTLRATENFRLRDGRPQRRDGFGFWGGVETRIQGQQLTKQTAVTRLGLREDEDTSLAEFSEYERHPNSYGLIRWHDDFQPNSTRDWTVEFQLTLGEKERLVETPENRQTRGVWPGVATDVRAIYGTFVYDQTVIASYCDFDITGATQNLRPPTVAGRATVAADVQYTETLALSALAIAYWEDQIRATCTLIDTGVYFPQKVNLNFAIGTYTPGDTYHVAVRYTNSTRVLDLVVDGTIADTYTLLAGEKFAGEEDAINAKTTAIQRDIVLLNECTVRGAYSSTCKISHVAHGCTKFTQDHFVKLIEPGPPNFRRPPAVVPYCSPPRGTGMSELRIWHSAKTDGELSSNSLRELSTPYDAALKGYWRLNDGGGILVEKVAERHGSLHNTYPQYIADKNLIHKQGIRFSDNQYLTASLDDAPYLQDIYESIKTVFKGKKADILTAATKLEVVTDFTIQCQITLPYTAQQEINSRLTAPAYPDAVDWGTHSRETPGDGTAPFGGVHYMQPYEMLDGGATAAALGQYDGLTTRAAVAVSMFHPAYDQTIWSIEARQKLNGAATNDPDLRRVPLARGLLDPELRPIFEFFCDGATDTGGGVGGAPRYGRYLRVRGAALTPGATHTLTFKKFIVFEDLGANPFPIGFRMEIWVDNAVDVQYDHVTVAAATPAVVDLNADSRAVEHREIYDINIGASYVGDTFDRSETAPVDNTEFTFPVKHGKLRNRCYQDQPGFFTLGFFRMWAGSGISSGLIVSPVESTYNQSIVQSHVSDHALIINLEIDQVTGDTILNKTKYPLAFRLGYKSWHVANADQGATAQKWIFEEFQWGNEDCLGYNKLPSSYLPTGATDAKCNLLSFYSSVIARAFGLFTIFEDSPFYDDDLSGLLSNVYVPNIGLMNEFAAGQKWHTATVGDRLFLTAEGANPKVFNGKAIAPVGFGEYRGAAPQLEFSNTVGVMAVSKFYGVRIVYFAEEDNIRHISPLAILMVGDRFVVATAVIASGGSGYAVNDVLSVSGGTGVAATVTVTSVSGGVIDGISLAGVGNYTVQPTSPAATTVVPPGGTGATLSLTFSDAGRIDLRQVQAHPDLRVTSFRIYRTIAQPSFEEAEVSPLFLLPGGAYENKYSVSINISGADVDLLPAVLDLTETTPPVGSLCAEYNDSLWIGGDPRVPDAIYKSDSGNPQRFDVLTNQIINNQPTGELITSLTKIFGALYIGRASSIHRLVDLDNGRVDLLKLVGVGPVSARAVESVVLPDDGRTVLAFWSKFGPYLFDGQQEEYLGYPIELESSSGQPFDWLDAESVFLLHDPSERELIFFYKSVTNGTTADRHDKAVVFNYRTRSWYAYGQAVASYAISAGFANSATVAAIGAGSATTGAIPLTPTQAHKLVVGGPNGHLYEWGTASRDGEHTDVSINPSTVVSWSTPTLTLTGTVFTASDVVRGVWVTVYRPSTKAYFSLPALTNGASTLDLDLSYGAVAFAPAASDLVYVGQPPASLELPWDDLDTPMLDKSVPNTLIWTAGAFEYALLRDWSSAAPVSWTTVADNSGKRKKLQNAVSLCEVVKLYLHSTALGATLNQFGHLIDNKMTANLIQ